jgi:tetratricopeptide repeat protein
MEDHDRQVARERNNSRTTAMVSRSSTQPLKRSVLKAALWPLKTSWNIAKWLVGGGAPRLIWVVGLGATVYAAYRLPPDFLDRNWPYFGAVRRPLFWLLKGTGVQSILGALSLLVAYSFVYWFFFIRKRRFIVVAEFRVWGTLAKEFPDKGVAARLRDELQRVWHAITVGDVAEHAPLGSAATEPRLPDDGGLSLPETHVTLQYEGISLEAMNTLVRRTSGREIVITGDLMENSSGLTLSARAADLGSWDVTVGHPRSDTLPLGLQRLAIRIMTAMTNRFQPTSARTYALLQMKAREVRDYEEAFRLARLGRAVATDVETANWNLATAHHDIGVELANKKEYSDAVREFEEAIKLNPNFVEAYEYLGHAYRILGEKEKAAEAFSGAERVQNGSVTVGRPLSAPA